jgi:hypothetical protein
MIYRLLIDTVTSTFDAETSQWRDHFFFTEAGWKRYGRHVYAAARRRGHRLRLIRRKNPAPSQVVYRNAFQVAILPLTTR